MTLLKGTCVNTEVKPCKMYRHLFSVCHFKVYYRLVTMLTLSRCITVSPKESWANGDSQYELEGVEIELEISGTS